MLDLMLVNRLDYLARLAIRRPERIPNDLDVQLALEEIRAKSKKPTKKKGETSPQT